MSEPLRVVLWDMDGTLVRTLPKGAANVYFDAVSLVGGKPLVSPVERRHGTTDGEVLWSLLAENGLPEDLHAEATAHVERLSAERDRVPGLREATPGISDALRALAEDGWVNGLLTGNSATRARFKMEGTGIDPDLFDWSRGFFGSQARVRSDITSRAAAELAGAVVVIIGDSPEDGIAADHFGIPWIAVATGRFEVGVLRETSAVLVVPDMREGLPAVRATLADLAAR